MEVSRFRALLVTCVLAVLAPVGWHQTLCAQQVPAPASAGAAAPGASAGANMAQTIATINDSFAKQGTFISSFSYDVQTTYQSQSVQAENECSLVLSNTKQHDFHGLTHAGTERFILHLDRTDALSLSIDPYQTATSTLYLVKFAHTFVEARPLEIRSSAPTDMKADKFYLEGVVRSVSGSSLALAANDGNLYSISLDSKTLVMGAGQQGLSLANVKGGDNVWIFRQKNDHPMVMLFKNPRKTMTVGVFTEEDSAKRVAKALIHAVVLCHSGQPSSSF